MARHAAMSVTNPRPMPARAGIGLRAAHFADVLATELPPIGSDVRVRIRHARSLTG